MYSLWRAITKASPEKGTFLTLEVFERVVKYFET